MKRKIININEDLCIGCGSCTTSCHQGALKIINGKARLVREDFCDGLGKCIGKCPTDALTIIEKEVEEKPTTLPCGCPGTMAMDRRGKACTPEVSSATVKEINGAVNTIYQNQPSELRQWPVQLHLVSPGASYFKDSELVILSTCSPVASAQIHARYIKDHPVVVACPKLDRTEGYVEKLSEIFKYAGTPRVKVVIMSVPCCKGLSSMVLEAARLSGRSDLVVEEHVISLEGNLDDVKEIKY